MGTSQPSNDDLANIHKKIDRMEDLVHQRVNHLFLKDISTKVCVLETKHQKALLATLVVKGYRVTTIPEGAGAIIGDPQVLARLGFSSQPIVFIPDPIDLGLIVDNLLVAFGPPIDTRRNPR